MKIDRRGLELVLREMNELTEVEHQTPAQKSRFAYLVSASASIRAGCATLADLDMEQHKDRARAAGVYVEDEPESRDGQFLSKKAERRAKEFQQFIRSGPDSSSGFVEMRDSVDIEGVPMTSQIGSYSNFGFFVPTEFFPKIFSALKAHDCLFDDEVSNVIRSSNGRPLEVPTLGDTTNVAQIVGEAGARSTANIFRPGHASLGAFSYATPMWQCSIEAAQDIETAATYESLFRSFAADRLARGIGAHLVIGNGVGQPTGLVVAALAAGVTAITAVGNSESTGGSQNGANSLGSSDFANAFAALDPAYLASPKVRWLMSFSTFCFVLKILDKNGRPLKLIQYENGRPTIYGIPVGICPSMSSIAASNYTVALADLNYFAVRLVAAQDSGILIYRERYAEQGKVALQAFIRADSQLLYTDYNSPAPCVLIQQHS